MKITQIREHTAGIDIGSEHIFIGLDDDSVHQFGTFTCEFHAAIKLLAAHGVQSITMESTGVYGVIFHEMLQEAGFDVWRASGIPANWSLFVINEFRPTNTIRWLPPWRATTARNIHNQCN